MSCCRSDGTSIVIYCYYRGRNQDACRVVLESAYATHLACVIMWNKAFCVYPWALGMGDTFLLTCFLSGRQRRELESWLAGKAREVRMDSRYLGSARDVDVTKWWTVHFSSGVRKLRR